MPLGPKFKEEDIRIWKKVKQVSFLYVLQLMTQYIFLHHKVCVVHYSLFGPKSLPFLCEIFHLVNVSLLELKCI